MANRFSVLLVDDDLNVRQSLEQALALEDFHVVPAANSLEAMRGFGENWIDVVLLDVHLGTENGWDTCRELRRIEPRLPVIMMSGHAGESAAAATSQEILAFLEKPLDLALLFGKLGELAAIAPAPAANRRPRSRKCTKPSSNTGL